MPSDRLYGLLVLTLLATACAGGPPEDLGTNAAEKRISPEDEENLGILEVTLPSGWSQVPSKVSATYRDKLITIGAPNRLLAGTGCLVLSSPPLRNLKECGVKVVARQTTKYELGSLEAPYSPPGTGTLAVDFGPQAAPQVWRAGVNEQGNTPWMDVWHPGYGDPARVFGGAPAAPVVTMPGDYWIGWNVPVLGETLFAIAPGSNKTIDITPPERRATIRVKAPIRELPDARRRCGTDNRNFIVHRQVANPDGLFGEPDGISQRQTLGQAANSPREGLVEWKSFPLAQDTTIRVFPFVASEGARHYEWIAKDVVIPIEVQPGQAVDLTMGRLDVDHVKVTKEDGTTYQATGQYRVWRKAKDGAWVPVRSAVQAADCRATGNVVHPTGTGMDLPPGDYSLVVDYVTAEGPQKKTEYVTLP